MAIPVSSSKQFDILNLISQLLNLYVDMLRDFKHQFLTILTKTPNFRPYILPTK